MTEAEIVPALESILADENMFISKLQDIEPGTLTFEEIKELEWDVSEAFDLLKEVMSEIGDLKPDPKVIGNRFKIAFTNVSKILEMLTRLYGAIPGK